MAKPDPFLNLLKETGFLPLRLPREDAAPLTLAARRGKDLVLLGNIAEALNFDERDRPPITLDIKAAANVQSTRTSTIKASLGTSILENILLAVTGNPVRISAAYQRAATITIEFAGVTIDKVDVARVDRFLGRSAIHPDNRSIGAMLKSGSCALITAAARCRRYIVSAQDQTGASLNLDLGAIKVAAGTGVAVEAAGTVANTGAYAGEKALVFAVQAVRIAYDRDGRFTAFEPIASGAAAVRDIAPPKPAWLDAPGIFVDVVRP